MQRTPGASGVGGWSPANIDTIAGWWIAGVNCYQDIAKTIPAVADTDPIACWSDITKSAKDWTQSVDGNRPVIEASSLNGLPSVKFTAASSQYLNRASGIPLATTFYAHFYVVKFRAVTLNSGVPYSNHALAICTNSGYFVGAKNSSGAKLVAFHWDGGTKVTPNLSIDTTNYFLITHRYDGSNIYLGKNGQAEVSVAAGNITDQSAMNLGRNNAPAYSDMNICEMISYAGTRARAAIDIARIQSYLSQKYNITLG